MPIFEYVCQHCGRVTAFLEKAGTEDAHVCQECSSRKMEKVFSTFAAITTGSSSACDDAACPAFSRKGCMARERDLPCHK